MREAEYVVSTPLSHRKQYGQFFTPPSIARLMVQWVLKNEPSTILDPSFGLGIFYDEIVKMHPKYKVEFTGYEVDKNIISWLNFSNDMPGFELRNADYLEARSGSYDGIICNPPYLRFQKFSNRHTVLPLIEKQIGKKLAGYSNIASVFLVKALNELNDNGNLAFIMPFEFFNTGYGKEVKKIIVGRHLLKQVVIFSNEKEIFPDATTTVCILLCKKDGIETGIKISHIDANVNVSAILDIGEYFQKVIQPSDLPSDRKWTPIISSFFSKKNVPDGFVKLSFYGAFTRGIATGANEYFALDKEKIARIGLDKGSICKCITKSSQIRKLIFTERDFNELYNLGKPVYCLNVSSISNSSVQRYIQHGEECRYHERYLTKVRRPWYKIERRIPAPLLFGVFSRGRLKVIRNMTNAINFTCFHCFYPNMIGDSMISKLFVYFVSDIGQAIIKSNKRSYGAELDKFEPGDLNEALCPNQSQFELILDSEAESVLEIAQYDEKMAINLSNILIERVIANSTCDFNKILDTSCSNSRFSLCN